VIPYIKCYTDREKEKGKERERERESESEREKERYMQNMRVCKYIGMYANTAFYFIFNDQ